MNRNHKLEEYKKLDQQYLHRGWKQIIGHLYPTDNRTLDQYMNDIVTHMNTRVLINPQEAVGGNWDTLPQKHMQILQSVGLKPQHTVLDFGCGTLRTGRKLIPFLETGNYYGIDISPIALDYCHQTVQDNVELKEKQPLLHSNSPEQLIPVNNTFDFIICFSVIYDMPERVFEQFLNEAIDHMHEDSVFVFSWCKRNVTYRATDKLFTWLHSKNIIERTINKRNVTYSELPGFLEPNDEQIIGMIEK